jgi:DNA-binding response OmpR family regulator
MKKRILVVNDNPFMRETLNLILLRAGYQVGLAEDDHDAIRKARAERPSLVLIDGLLPDLPGFQVSKALKELAAPPKVILLTGVYTKPSYGWEAKAYYGVDDVLLKPFKTAELLVCLEKHLASPVDLPAVAPLIENQSEAI